MNIISVLCFVLVVHNVASQPSGLLNCFTLYNDVSVTIEVSEKRNPKYEWLIILYALPNGNSTLQTMGKKAFAADDWRFGIQHIKAQTSFLRKELPEKNIAVIYLENAYKSWPQWKIKHPAYATETQHIVDTVFNLFSGKKSLYLNGHSGGGRFIFSYLDCMETIPSFVKNITFLDSDYGYDATYFSKLLTWLKNNKDTRLNVFAYNDSVALLNGKHLVSDTGGTWYRSRLLLRHLQSFMPFDKIREDSLLVYYSHNKRIRFYLKNNPEQRIFHTQQVELNGFIHSILIGTTKEEKRYRYFGQRAYTEFIE